MRLLSAIGYLVGTIVFGLFLLLAAAPWGGENYGPSGVVRVAIFGVYALFCIIGSISVAHAQKTKLDLFLIWSPVVAVLIFAAWSLTFS